MPTSIGGTLHLFSDGGSRGNPGHAAAAWIVEDNTKGEILEEEGLYLGEETNNVAEYRALIEGLKSAIKYQPRRLVCHMDSELIVRQLNGQYRVNMPTLKAFVEEIRELTDQLADVAFVHIPRQDNYRADSLVNRTLDEAAPQSKKSPWKQSSQNTPSWQRSSL